MHNVLPNDLKESLATYEEDKYIFLVMWRFSEMHRVILNDDGHAKL